MSDFDGDDDVAHPFNLIFPAKLTAQLLDVPTGLHRYAWTEQEYTAVGALVNTSSPRSGTTSLDYATEVGNALVTTPCFVWLRFATIVNGQSVYEFTAGTPSTGGGSLTVTDPTHSFPSTSTLNVPTLHGLTVAQPSAGLVTLDITAAGTSAPGVVTTGAQTFAGDKTFAGNVDIVGVDHLTLTALTKYFAYTSSLPGYNSDHFTAESSTGVWQLTSVYDNAIAPFNFGFKVIKNINGPNTGMGFVITDGYGVPAYLPAYGVATSGSPTLYGKWGTDALGNVFSAGICTTIGGGTASIAWTSITGTPTTLAGYGITDAQPLNAKLTSLAGLTPSANQVIVATGSSTLAAIALTDAYIAAGNKDGGTSVPSLRTLGTGAQQALPGNISLDLITAPAGDVSINSHKVTNVLDPTAAQDVVTLAYFTSHFSGGGGGGGTVTSVSVTSHDGVSGTVLNPTTTPAISLTLGNVTPLSIVASGTITGSNLSGVNSGDQTISLTGDVTGSGTGSFAATIAALAVTTAKLAALAVTTAKLADAAVTNVKLADMPSLTLKGNDTGGAGVPLDLTASQVRTLLALAAIATSGSASDLITGTVPAARMPALTGDVTTSAGSVVTTLATLLTAGSVGSNQLIPVLAYDSKGRLTSASSIGVSVAAIGAVPTSRQVIAGVGLSGGGNLSADVTLSLPTLGTAGTYGSADLIPVITTDAYARVTTVSSLAPSTPFHIIDNGNFQIAQRGLPVSAVSGFFIDRWQYLRVGTCVHTASLETTSLPNAQSTQCPKLSCTTAQATFAGSQYSALIHAIEGYNFIGIAQRAFTLSFWVKSFKTGTFCVAFQNSGQDRSYVCEYQIINSNTWTQVGVQVSASPSAGTWNYTSGGGLYINFTQACGGTVQTTANAWQTGNYMGTSSQVNNCDSTNNTFLISQVQITPGTGFSQFVPLPYALQLQRCQRYYATSNGLSYWFNGAVTIGNSYYAQSLFPVQMRAIPTVSLSNIGSLSFGATPGTPGVNQVGFYETRPATATTAWGYFESAYTASADI